MIVLLAVTLYAAVGIVIAAAFLAVGVTRVLPAPAAVTLGARIMLFPGAVALWPYVLIRWLRSSPSRDRSGRRTACSRRSSPLQSRLASRCRCRCGNGP